MQEDTEKYGKKIQIQNRKNNTEELRIRNKGQFGGNNIFEGVQEKKCKTY